MPRRKSKKAKQNRESGSPTDTARLATATNIPGEDLTDSGSEKSSSSPKPAKPQQAKNKSTKKPPSVSDDGKKAAETARDLDQEHCLPFGPATCENKIDIKLLDIVRPHKPPVKLSIAPTDSRLLEYCCPKVANISDKTITAPAFLAPYLQSILHWVHRIQEKTSTTKPYRYKPYVIEFKTPYAELAHLHAAATMLRMDGFAARLVLSLKTTDIRPHQVPWLYKSLGLGSAGVQLILDNLAAEYVFRSPRTSIKDRFLVKDILSTVSLCEATREGFKAAFRAQVAKMRDCGNEERCDEEKEEKKKKKSERGERERETERKKNSTSDSSVKADEKVKRDRRENEGGSKKPKKEAVVRAPLDAPVCKHEVRRAPDGLLYVVKPMGSNRPAGVTGLAALGKALKGRSR